MVGFMFRRTVLPLALLALVVVAFAAAAWGFSASRDLAGVYWVVVGLVALRAEHRIARAGET
jgi:hypothetical protein